MDNETVIITRPFIPRHGPRGFFSMVIQAVSNLYDLRGKYSRFYFDYSNNMLFQDNCFGEENFFNNYFVQDKNLLAAPRKKYIDWIVKWPLRREVWQHITGPDRDDVSALLRKHIKIKDHIIAKVEALWLQQFQGRKVLGLHKRGTDHGLHGPLLQTDYYFSVIDQHIDQYDALYLATDEEHTLASFQKRYQKKLIHLEGAFRSCDSNSIHTNNFTNNYKKGEDVLIEAVLLSRVELLLRTQSNITLFSILYNKEVAYKRIDTHIQYH